MAGSKNPIVDPPRCPLMEGLTVLEVTCTASISIGFSVCLKHISLFGCAKIGARTKSPPSTTLSLPPPPPLPVFVQPKSKKNASNVPKRAGKTLATQATPEELC